MKRKSKTAVLGLFFLPFFSFVSASPSGTVVTTVSINPLALEVLTPSVVRVGRPFRVKARIGNLGQSKIKETTAVISVPPGLTIKGAEEKKVGVIRGEGEKTVSWQIKANQLGFYVIQIEARGIVVETGDLVSRSETAKVEVRAEVSFWTALYSWWERRRTPKNKAGGFPPAG